MIDNNKSLSEQVKVHSALLESHSTSINQLLVTTDRISLQVDQLPEKLNGGLSKVYDRLDKHIENNKPDIKWGIAAFGGTITILLTIFSIMLSLTVEPMRADIQSVATSQIEYNDANHKLSAAAAEAIAEGAARDASLAAKLVAVTDANEKWDELQNKYIDEGRDRDMVHDIKIGEIKATLKTHLKTHD